MAVSKPIFRCTFAGKEITTDLAPFLLSINYTDKVSGEADEIALELQDSDGLWSGPWYPTKGDKIEVELGYDGAPLLPCGVFQIDEVELKGPPDTVSIRGLAAGITGSLRTKRSSAHEQIALRDIAKTIAERNGLTLVDGTAKDVNKGVTFEPERQALKELAAQVNGLREIGSPFTFATTTSRIALRLDGVIESLRTKGKNPQAEALDDIRSLQEYKRVLTGAQSWDGYLDNGTRLFSQVAANLKDQSFKTTVSKLDGIRVDRVTQNEETDLAFLARVSAAYGLMFNIRNEQLIFTASADIERSDSVLTLSRSSITSYSFRDKTADTYKRARVKHHDPDNKEVVEATVNIGDDDESLDYEPETAGDDYEEISRVENSQQAEAKAKANLHSKNSETQSANISLPGNVLMVSGANVTLTGLGKLSGHYTIKESQHNFSRSGGYTTECELKKIGNVSEELQQRPKPTE